MYTYFQLGSSPEVSQLELRALLSETKLHQNGLVSAPVLMSPESAREFIEDVGGVVRVLTPLGELMEVVKLLKPSDDAPHIRDIGVSFIKLDHNERKAAQRALTVLLKERGGARLILPLESSTELTAAQVLGNRLTTHPRAAELVVTKEKQGFFLYKTIAITNPTAFADRDRGIPRPDAKNGMLPPKLALMMVNIATQGENIAVYDPFCGSGRILLEASGLGLQVLGSDITPLQVRNARENLEWAGVENAKDLVWETDATALTAERLPEAYVTATEPYLGPPLTGYMKYNDEASHQKWRNDVYPRIEAFLKALKQGRSPKRIVMVLPVPILEGGVACWWMADDMVDNIMLLGYDVRARADYARPDAYLIRRILCLEPVTP